MAYSDPFNSVEIINSFQETGTGGLSAVDTYEEWATELGVSTTDSLLDLEGTYICRPFNLGFPLTLGKGNSNIIVTSDGAVGLYSKLVTITGESEYRILSSPVDMGFINLPNELKCPAVILFVGPKNQARVTVGSRVQKAPGMAILLLRTQRSGVNNNHVDVAYKIKTGVVEMVVTIGSSNTTSYFQWAETVFYESGVDYFGNVGALGPYSAVTTTRYLSLVDPVGSARLRGPLQSPSAIAHSLAGFGNTGGPLGEPYSLMGLNQGEVSVVGPLGVASAIAGGSRALVLSLGPLGTLSATSDLPVVYDPEPLVVSDQTYLKIVTNPSTVYYLGGEYGGEELSYPLLSGISAVRRPLSFGPLGVREASNMTVDLVNHGGDITRHLGTRPPLRSRAEVFFRGQSVFAGTITGVSLGEVARITIESGGFRPSTDRIPLRNTTVWGGFKEPQVIPHAYGLVRVKPIPYDKEGRLFVLADHSILDVVRVTRDSALTNGWALSNELDSTGHPIAVLELESPLAQGEELRVQLNGKRHRETGQLLNTPALVLWDLLNNVLGFETPWSDLDSFRVETEGILIGGLLDDATKTARSYIDDIVGSVGGAWSFGMPGFATLWPPEQDEQAPAIEVTKLSATNCTAQSEHSYLHTHLRINYDYDFGEGSHRKAILLVAPDAVKDFGVIELEWDASWLRSPRIAETVGRRILRNLARPQWMLDWEQDFTIVETGGWVDIDHPHLPVSGRHRLSDAELNFSGATLKCASMAAVGPEPKVVTVSLATAFEPAAQSGAAVTYSDGVASFELRDEAGGPMAGAKVILNGSVTRYSNNGGFVSFDVPRGKHVLYIEATGYMPMEIEVVV